VIAIPAETDGAAEIVQSSSILMSPGVAARRLEIPSPRHRVFIRHAQG
jgi:hypothetical protein